MCKYKTTKLLQLVQTNAKGEVKLFTKILPKKGKARDVV